MHRITLMVHQSPLEVHILETLNLNTFQFRVKGTEEPTEADAKVVVHYVIVRDAVARVAGWLAVQVRIHGLNQYFEKGKDGIDVDKLCMENEGDEKAQATFSIDQWLFARCGTSPEIIHQNIAVFARSSAQVKDEVLQMENIRGGKWLTGDVLEEERSDNLHELLCICIAIL